MRMGDTPEYRVHKKNEVPFAMIEDTQKKSTQNQKTYSQIKVTMPVERVWHHYVINIYIMLAILVVASFANYTVPIEEYNNRLSNAVTFVLTSMALKYIVADQLPKKKYQTHLDWYILGSYFTLCAPALELTSIWLCSGRVSYEHEKGIGRWFNAHIIFLVWSSFSVLWFHPLVRRWALGIDWARVCPVQEISGRTCASYSIRKTCDSDGDAECSSDTSG